MQCIQSRQKRASQEGADMSGNPYDDEYNEDEMTEKQARIIKHQEDKNQMHFDGE